MESATGRDVHRIDAGGYMWGVRFSPDDQWLEVVQSSRTRQGIVYARYPLAADELVREACATVTRNLTVAEWNQYVGPEIPYERTCENLPFPPDYRPAS
jgi:hypothetical protein